MPGLVAPGAGAFSALLTAGVYAVEDLFGRLPFHWMWWPALGGLTIGLGGLVFPQALGNDPKNVGEAASHEAGHNLGLQHDGTGSVGYYSGHGSWATASASER